MRIVNERVSNHLGDEGLDLSGGFSIGVIKIGRPFLKGNGTIP